MIGVTPPRFAERFPDLASALGAEDLGALLTALEVQEVVPSEALMTEQTPVDDLFLVWDGRLDVSVATPTGERAVAQVEAGSLLGEVSLLDPGPATASVTAEQGCTVLRLGRARFDELCDTSPTVAAALLGEIGRILAERLRQGVAVLDAGAPEPVAVHTALHAAVRT